MGQGSVLKSPEPFRGLQMDSSVRILKQPVQSLMFPSGTMARSPLLMLMAPRVVSFTMRMVRSLLLSPASGLFSMPFLLSRRRIVRLRGFPVTTSNRTVIWIRSWAFYLLLFSLRFSFLFFRGCFFRLSFSWLLSPSFRCSGSPPWKLAPLIFFLLCTAVHLSGLGGFQLLGCLCCFCLSFLVSLASYRRLHPYWDIPQSFDCTHVAQYEVVSNPPIRCSPRSRELGAQFFCSRAARAPTIAVKGNPGFAAIAKRGHKTPPSKQTILSPTVSEPLHSSQLSSRNPVKSRRFSKKKEGVGLQDSSQAIGSKMFLRCNSLAHRFFSPARELLHALAGSRAPLQRHQLAAPDPEQPTACLTHRSIQIKTGNKPTAHGTDRKGEKNCIDVPRLLCKQLPKTHHLPLHIDMVVKSPCTPNPSLSLLKGGLSFPKKLPLWFWPHMYRFSWPI